MRIEDPRGALQHPVEHVERVALVAAADVEVQRVDPQAGRPRGRDRLVEAVRVHAELGRLLAGVAQPLVVAGAEAGVQADADGPARAAPAEPADRADRIAIDVHARMRLQDVEIRVGDRVAREGNVGFAEPVPEREPTSAGEQASMPQPPCARSTSSSGAKRFAFSA